MKKFSILIFIAVSVILHMDRINAKTQRITVSHTVNKEVPTLFPTQFPSVYRDKPEEPEPEPQGPPTRYPTPREEQPHEPGPDPAEDDEEEEMNAFKPPVWFIFVIIILSMSCIGSFLFIAHRNGQRARRLGEIKGMTQEVPGRFQGMEIELNAVQPQEQQEDTKRKLVTV